MAYSFGGRSDGSKNRTAIPLEDGSIRLVDPDKTPEEMAQVSDAALIYYNAMESAEGVFVVSNGAQTSPVLDALVDGASLEEAVTEAPTVPGMMDGKEIDIDLSSFEPDKLNTDRITGVVDLRPNAVTPFGLAVVRKNLVTSEPVRSFYTAKIEDIRPGNSWAVQTYGVNDPDDLETPVPQFDQPPYAIVMIGNTHEVAGLVREAIGERTYAASVIHSISIATGRFSGHTIDNTRG